ncbi:MAG: PD40 domain-containing protein [Flavobacteriaceae bacterium]|nr:PD40 domain-containing protein [Flavobacteriaceae bacterium]
MLFFPGTVTQRGKVHFGSSFSDDGKYIVYTITARGKPGTVVTQTFEKDAFSTLVPIENDSIFSYSDASISPDGNTITLASNRPHNWEQTTRQNGTLWQFHRTKDGWGNPNMIKLDLNPEGTYGFPTMTRNKTLYFHYSAGGTKPDIYRAEFIDGKYKTPEKLPYPINTDKFEGDVFVDREEQYIIFVGFGREDNLGHSDLYISFKLDTGWSNVFSLGKNVNSYGFDGSPSVTADGEYLVFTSSRHPENDGEHEYFNLFYVEFNIELYRSMIIKN